MKLAVNSEIKELDRMVNEVYGLPSIVLMENAGRSVAEETLSMSDSIESVIIIAGIGRKGGEGLVAARHLIQAGKKVRIFIVGNIKQITGDAFKNYQILMNLKVKIDVINDMQSTVRLEKILSSFDVVIDALIGTGLEQDLTGLYLTVVNSINATHTKVLSIDIPTGIRGDDGKVMGEAVNANKTVVLGVPKCGNYLFPGNDYNGELVVREIGMTDDMVESAKIRCELIDMDLIKNLIPRRERYSHKSTYGKVSVVAGSVGLTGAAILTCRAALRSGIGMLKLFVPESLNFIITNSVPEAITVPLSEARKGIIGLNHIDRIIEESEGSNVVAIGPGCGNTSEVAETVRRIIQNMDKPVVIDADGINALARNVNILKDKKASVVLTPHLGEMSRLTGLSTDEIRDDLIQKAITYAKEWDVVLVLKDTRTVVADPEGRAYVNINGNSGMATAGSGDVLTGIITGFIAQGLTTLDASLLGVFVHGMSGDYAAEKTGEHGLLAGDIVKGLAHTMKELMHNIK